MACSVTVTRQPALARGGDPAPAGHGALRDAMRAVSDRLVADLRGRSARYQSIAAGWRGETQDAGREIVLYLLNDAPGTPFLDQGASWPNKMPNIGAIADWLASKGDDPKDAWITSKRLQLKGMPAQHWTRDALAAAEGDILSIHADAIRRWLRGLA